jgi:hypothetical protein
MSRRSLVVATLVGTLLQVAMVVAGHTNPALKGMFAVGGMTLSLLAGLLYGWLARPVARGASTVGGLLAGAICAFVGILVSYLLGDVPTSLLALGTVSSAVTGAIGGFLAALTVGRRAAPAASAVVLSLSLLASSSGPARAQGAAAPAESPAARGDAATTLADFRWLVGRWEGTVTKLPDAVAEVTFSSPRAGMMTGMMRLVKHDTVLVVELISMVDTPHGVEMRFRHFSPTLEAYERDFRQTMRLTRHESAMDTFENTVPFESTLMSTQPRRTVFVRRSDDAYVGRSDIIGADGKPDVVETTYHRMR